MPLVGMLGAILQCSLSWACCCRFLDGDLDDPAANSRRHNMLKLIPSVPQGSWIIKQSVGSTPVLLGNKISTTYHRYHSLIHPAQYIHSVVYILSRLSLYSMYVVWSQLCLPSCAKGVWSVNSHYIWQKMRHAALHAIDVPGDRINSLRQFISSQLDL